MSAQTPKDNSRKTGWAAERKAKRREEAEARNEEYRLLPHDVKLARQTGKVRKRLMETA